MNYDEIYQNFIGNDKIQPLSITRNKKTGEWKLKFREGKFIREVECEDRNELDKILIEFGGRNPETCKADDRFLEINGEWGSEELNELGHRVTKISLSGERLVRQTTIPIEMAEGTGYQNQIQSKRMGLNKINFRMTDREMADLTRAFKETRELDELIKFIFGHQSLKELKWFVQSLVTESKDTSRQCLWRRVQAGDGTRKMVLELRELDGKKFTACVRKDLFDSAGDMFDAPCKRVKTKKKKPPERDICFFAAEDGSVDLSDYEAA